MATKQPELPAPEATPKTKRVADPELLAINNIAKHMAELDVAAQGRVMSYLCSRFPSVAYTALPPKYEAGPAGND